MKVSIPILVLLLLCSISVCQETDKKYRSQNGEHLHFLNDNLVRFSLINSYRGALASFSDSEGEYYINDDSLTITTEESSYLYLVTEVTDKTFVFVGPIIEDYRKLNRRRYWNGFLNWPWRWSFRKQNWYDPREHQLKIE